MREHELFAASHLQLSSQPHVGSDRIDFAGCKTHRRVDSFGQSGREHERVSLLYSHGVGAGASVGGAEHSHFFLFFRTHKSVGS